MDWEMAGEVVAREMGGGRGRRRDGIPEKVKHGGGKGASGAG